MGAALALGGVVDVAIKYLGSKRVLVPVLGELLSASGARTALDLFTGTTRVAQEFCRRGAFVYAVDIASYSEVLAQCYVEADSTQVDVVEIEEAIESLNALPDVRGYVTKTFCEDARYFHPKNGQRIDAIRQGIDDLYADSYLRPILLTSLMEAADAVDSTVGLQMAYLKEWAPRALKDLELRVPVLTPGTGRAIRGDALELVGDLPPVDLAYLDPPYNQHRYFTNYHIWETLIRWDHPEHYGIACKRLDARDEETKSVFNKKRQMPTAFARTIAAVKAQTLVISFSNEGYVSIEELVEMCKARGDTVEVLAFDHKRYVGAIIGIYDPAGEKVGKISHTKNTEYIVLSGKAEHVAHMAAAVAHHTK
ncbi:MAG: DNA adenine methylase [Actinomycetaceae bacterium]|nr:DNA adenine methylase [Actinomycetaceae bacterium]